MIKALVPVKENSERLRGKNFLPFCGQPLYQVVLDTLQNTPGVESIIIDTDSEHISDVCAGRYSKVLILKRPPHLIGNHITMNTIIDYDLSLVDGENFLQTHVTNPLLSVDTIVNAINIYFRDLQTYDSLFSVEAIKKRVYDHMGNPLNHSLDTMLPTQELPQVNTENSNLFLFSRSSFLSSGKRRIGRVPQMFYMSSIEGIDIDYEDDFKLAELIAKNRELFNF